MSAVAPASSRAPRCPDRSGRYGISGETRVGDIKVPANSSYAFWRAEPPWTARRVSLLRNSPVFHSYLRKPTSRSAQSALPVNSHSGFAASRGPGERGPALPCPQAVSVKSRHVDPHVALERPARCAPVVRRIISPAASAEPKIIASPYENDPVRVVR
jgi:hypothetical protein